MEVTPAQVLALLREGTAPLRARAAIARNAFPMPPALLLESLVILADDPDPGVQSDASGSLERLPAAVVRAVSSSPSAAPELLDGLARHLGAREAVALDLARNAATPPATMACLAALPHVPVLEVIGRNQALLESAPAVVAALLENPATPAPIAQLWHEHLERSALRSSRPAPAREAPEPEEPDLSPLLTREDDEAAPGADGAAAGQRQASVYAELKSATMGQKIAAALKGNREARNILIRDTNKMVSLKVLENPRISDTDIEAYAKSTNISEDVLRGIANKKEWLKKYPIAKALVLNPRVPLGISLEHVKRLNQRDLEQLAKNRNVPETLRSLASRIVKQKKESNR